MNWVLGILSLLLIALIGYFLNTKTREVAEPEKLPYKLNPRFFTKSEYAFYQELKKQVGDRYEIFPKVRLADFIDVDIDKYKNRSEWQKYWNKIRSKHVDFLLCDKATLKPLEVIEVNGPSHETPTVQDRDTFVKNLYSAIGIELKVVLVGESFLEAVREN